MAYYQKYELNIQFQKIHNNNENIFSITFTTKIWESY